MRVGGDEHKAGKIILATGSIARPIPGAQFGGRVIGTEEAWAFDELPGRLAVVGAGASGTEIASAYARLGSEVILLEALDRVLPTEDADISKVAARVFKRQGIEVHTGVKVENIQSRRLRRHVLLRRRDGEADWLVIAAGRGPDVEALGLDEAGVERDDRGLIKVDGAMRTSADGHLRDRRHRARPGARPQGLRRGHHRRRGRRRPGHASARLRRHPARDVLPAQRRQLRPHRGAGARGRPRRRRSARSSTAPSAPAPSTATARASSRSSATRSTASCSAATSSGPRRPR